jgi:hypothetical protein
MSLELDRFVEKLNNDLASEQRRFEERVMSGTYSDIMDYHKEVAIYQTIGHVRAQLGITLNAFYGGDNDD